MCLQIPTTMNKLEKNTSVTFIKLRRFDIYILMETIM